MRERERAGVWGEKMEREGERERVSDEKWESSKKNHHSNSLSPQAWASPHAKCDKRASRWFGKAIFISNARLLHKPNSRKLKERRRGGVEGEEKEERERWKTDNGTGRGNSLFKVRLRRRGCCFESESTHITSEGTRTNVFFLLNSKTSPFNHVRVWYFKVIVLT